MIVDMIVYTVNTGDGDDGNEVQVRGIYSSSEKAESAIKDFCSTRPFLSKAEFTIFAVTLDESIS